LTGQQHVSKAEAEKQSNHVTPWFTSEQVQRLPSLIEPSDSGYEKLQGKPTWIVDSRASRHMTGDLQALWDKKNVPPIPVNLPNGTTVMANVEGSISLSSKLNLNKVLYVSAFACNLISVAKLSRHLRCIVIFDKDLCVI